MIYKKVCSIISDQLKIDVANITPESSIKDLGADSIALIDILMDIEEVFDVDIPEKKIGTNVCDIVDFIKANTHSAEAVPAEKAMGAVAEQVPA